MEDPDFDGSDGFELTKLAFECLNMRGYKRPKMEQAVKRFQD